MFIKVSKLHILMLNNDMEMDSKVILSCHCDQGFSSIPTLNFHFIQLMEIFQWIYEVYTKYLGS